MTDPDDHREFAGNAQPRACNCFFVPSNYIRYPRPRLLRVILAYFIMIMIMIMIDLIFVPRQLIGDSISIDFLTERSFIRPLLGNTNALSLYG